MKEELHKLMREQIQPELQAMKEELHKLMREQIQPELQAMKEELRKLMREKQQLLQQELQVAKTRREDLQWQLQQQVSDVIISSWAGLLSVDFIQEEKDAQAMSSETRSMEEHDAGNGGGEDSSPLQLTADDGECVLLYTVNTTHCTHYCDSDTCL